MQSAVDPWLGLSLVGSTLLLLILAWLRSRAARFDRVAREGGTPFLGERIMHAGYAWIDAAARLAARLGLSANQVTWLSLVLGAAAGVLVGAGWLGAGAWALALSGACDGIDGAVARQSGKPNPGGAVLDSTLDRYVEFFFLAGLMVFLRARWPMQLLAVATLFGSFMVTYSTAKAEALRIKPPRGWMKRSERLVWLTGGAAFAAIAALIGIPVTLVLGSVLVVVGVFANASAIVRLYALHTIVSRRERS